MELQPGDLILVQSEGAFFAFGRRLGGNAYDHVAVVGRGGQSVNIDKPRTRLLPAEKLLRPRFHPRVLRPAFPDDAARAAFVAELEALVDAPYDVARTLKLVAALLARRVGVRLRLTPLGRDRPRWICTDAVLLGLERHVPGFDAVRALPLDYVELGSGSTNDLLTISERRPDLVRAL